MRCLDSVRLNHLVYSLDCVANGAPHMSNFFQSLIDLGEENPSRASRPVDTSDVDNLTKEQLAGEVKRLQGERMGFKTEYDNLRAEATKLRGEYDAYKLKVETWQLKMKEARDEDRRLIEQLRAAGSHGGTDELFAKSMNETITKYKEELRDAHQKVERESVKRKEAEEARARFEESKKEEVATLLKKVEQTKQQMRSAQDTLKGRLTEATTKVSALQEQLRDAERARQAAEGRERTLQRQLAEAASPAPRAPSQGGDGTEADTDGAQSSTGGGASSAALAEALENVAALERQLEDEEKHRKESLAAVEERAADLSRQLEKANRQLQDAQWDTLEAEKRCTEARAEADAASTKVTAIEADLEQRVSEFALAEKKLLRQVRVAEEDLVAAKEQHNAAEAQHAAAIAELRSQLDKVRSTAEERDARIGEAEQLSQRTAEAVVAERKQLEVELAAAERRLHEAESMKQSLEETIRELRVDLRRRDDIADELREELDEQTQRTAELEASVVMNHRTVATREDDVANREREKAALKHQLQMERDHVERLRQQLADAEDRLADEQARSSGLSSTVAELQGDKSRLSQELRVVAQTKSDDAIAAEAAQKMIRDLQLQLADAGNKTADVVKLREDQSAKVRHLDSKVRELENRLQQATAEQRDAMPQRPHPSAVLTSAFPQNRITWAQSKTLIAGGLFLLLLLGFYNSFGNTPTRATDTDTVIALREKYAQALQATVVCKEALKNACACPPPGTKP